MKLLYGTGNPAKAAAMQNRIAGLGIELISLQDLQAQGVEIPGVPETGNTPLENARQKASMSFWSISVCMRASTLLNKSDTGSHR